MAEFERDLIRERVTAGMKSAKKAGRHVGRAAKMDAARTTEAHRMLDAGKSWGEVCRIFGIGKATLSRALARFPKEEGAERL
jgi:DNA invertase Pin-like site-specific DNA recombinase